jgi:hypothetical protein
MSDAIRNTFVEMLDIKFKVYGVSVICFCI